MLSPVVKGIMQDNMSVYPISVYGKTGIYKGIRVLVALVTL